MPVDQEQLTRRATGARVQVVAEPSVGEALQRHALALRTFNDVAQEHTMALRRFHG